MSRKIKTILLLTVSTAFIWACNSSQKEQKPIDEPMSQSAMIERGKYLVTAIGCNDCHSPKIMTPHGPVLDSARMLSGHPADAKLQPADVKFTVPGNWMGMAPDVTAFVGPFGISYAANLTSDSTTGIGSWQESNFINAMRTGKHMGIPTARPILPPMPWPGISKMTDEDLKAVFAFLKSTTPISNRVPQPVPPTEVGKEVVTVKQ